MKLWFVRVSQAVVAVVGLLFSWTAPAGPVLLNEIMYHAPPAVPEDPRKEWLELFNASTNAVDLTGWHFTKGIAFTFTNATLAAGGYLVVAADLAAFQTNYPGVTNVVGNWAGKLANSGEKLELADNLGQVADSVTFAGEGDWALRRVGATYPGQPGWWRGWQWTTPADGGGRSLELINPALPNSHGQNWTASWVAGGTPGRANSVLANDVAPLILDVKHLPAIPRATNTVTVTARLLDETGANLAVTLFHRVDGAASFTATAMFDDGAHGDGLAGDGVFGAQLPPQPDKTIVEFYLRATDGTGHTRTWPGPTDEAGTQAANALYQVDESSYAGSQPLYRLVITATEWNAWVNLMDAVSQGHVSDAAMNAALVRTDGLGTEVRYNVAVRNRGAGTRRAHPHNLHLSIPGDRPLQGLRKLDFNTRTVPAQVAGNALFSFAGLPNAYGTPVQVRVNARNLANASPGGGVDSYQFGSYYCFQPYDSDWAAAHLPQDSGGNLYRGVWYFDDIQLTNGAVLDYRGTNVANYRQAYLPTGPTPNTGPYLKQNNVPADDWSDLIRLCRTLNQTPEAEYLAALSNVVNIAEWLRYLAVNALIANEETTISTGVGDDYSMFLGALDPRCLLLNHDLDTVLGQGDTAPEYTRSIFQAADLPAVSRFLKHPAVAPLYYAALQQQADTTFSPAQIGPLLDQVLGGWVPASYLQAMKAVAEQRRTNVLAQIPLGLTAQSGLPVISGYPRSTTATTSLSGSANAIETRAVRVNGAPANYVPWQASWTAPGVALNPGINRVLIQSLDASGVEFARTNLDIWYDDGSVATVGAAIVSDTTWTAAGGPYSVTTSLTVSNGATLTLEPGTTVYLASGVNLIVADGGRLLAEGVAYAPIRFTVAPGSGVSWGGLTINGSVGSPETRIAHAFFESNGATCIEVAGGSLALDHTGFGTTTRPYLSLDGASFLISHCIFPSASAPFELIHGTGGIKPGGRGIVRDCFFGTTRGYNDIMDFTGGNRDLGQPIIQYYNNVFTGASDDILDLDGTDAWIEGNIFLHAHRNGSPDSSSAVSGGSYDFGGSVGGRTSEITMIGNLIFDCDQAATAKEGNFFTLLNNTIVHTTKTGGQDFASGVVNVRDTTPGVTAPGRGFYLEGNVIEDAEQLVRNYDAATTTVTFRNNLLPFAWTGPGGGNLTNNPRLKYMPQLSETQFGSWEQAQAMREWFSLRPGSPALGAGPDGRDLGGVIPLGASLAGAPLGTTTQTNATLTVGVVRSGDGIPVDGFPEGSGYTQYRWRLDGGAWSAETPTAAPITLAGLANGPHHVEVVGKRDSGGYQDDPELGDDARVTTSRTWTVDTTRTGVVINELLADNRGAWFVGEATPDAIELHNLGASPADLSGMGLSNDAGNPYKFTVPTGATLAGGQHLALVADTGVGTNLNTGFKLNKDGGALYLTAAPGNGGALLDSITYGHQLPNLSVGRRPGGWGLTVPTLGAPNVAQPTGDWSRLRLNEWRAASLFGDDFVELFNGDDLPVDLGGCFLSDVPDTWPARHQIAPLSFIPARGEFAFIADANPGAGANHLGFTLAHEWGTLGLFAPDLTPLDRVLYGPQTADVSMGRTPNGSSTLAFFPTPTPGSGNPGSVGPCAVSNVTIRLMSYTQIWNYDQTDNLDGVNWTATNYSDAAWPSGAGLLAFENNAAIVPLVRTTLADPRAPPSGLSSGHAYYFRSTVAVTSDLSAFTLTGTFRCDDGAIVYFNGTEAQRIRLPQGTVWNSTFASDMPGSGDAVADEYFTLPGSALRPGNNVIAVEVHQVNATSSDVVWGLALDATQTTTNCAPPVVVLNEVMAHNRSVANADGTVSDWVELFNPSSATLDLSDLSLSSDPANPRRWVFPAGASLVASGYLVVQFDSAAPASVTNGPVLNAGFGLDADGDKVLLYDTPANGGALLDSVTFGPQARDFSIGRVTGDSGAWTLLLPTPGAANVPAPLGDPAALRVNEWMADPVKGADWFELFNPNPQPVALAGLRLTDELNQPAQFTIPALSFVGTGPGGYAVFKADGTPAQGPSHVNFKLAAGGESLGLFAADGGTLIDGVTFGPQTTGVSEGRLPDGSTNWVRFAQSPTPGAPNTLVPDTDGDGLPDWWELANGTDPNVPDANADPDHDGMTNWQEFLAGTSPTNAASALRIESVQQVPGNSTALRFTAVADHTYTVQFQDGLAPGAWRKLADLLAEPATRTAWVTNGGDGSGARFYRLVTPKQN